jgi:phosphodiesterase/alkaline phosphatase D-like protein
MHHVPIAIAGDYHNRCAAEIERAADQLDHAAAFIESVILSVQPECFTREQRADLSEWLTSVRSAREALR